MSFDPLASFKPKNQLALLSPKNLDPRYGIKTLGRLLGFGGGARKKFKAAAAPERQTSFRNYGMPSAGAGQPAGPQVGAQLPATPFAVQPFRPPVAVQPPPMPAASPQLAAASPQLGLRPQLPVPTFPRNQMGY